MGKTEHRSLRYPIWVSPTFYQLVGYLNLAFMHSSVFTWTSCMSMYCQLIMHRHHGKDTPHHSKEGLPTNQKIGRKNRTCAYLRCGAGCLRLEFCWYYKSGLQIWSTLRFTVRTELILYYQVWRLAIVSSRRVHRVEFRCHSTKNGERNYPARHS